MKSFHLLVLLEVGATASRFSNSDVSFGVRRQPSFLKRRNINSKPSNEQISLPSALSIRGGAFDPYIGDIYYSEVSPESSKSEQSYYDATYASTTNNDSPVVSSAQVLYEGGCFVSNDPMATPESMMFGNYFNNYESDDEDEDDDDNDGHSSMLANGSLTRSRRMQSTARAYAYGSQRNAASSAVYLESEVQF